MVWWHGGAFKEGSSYGPFDLYDASHIVAAGSVVVVSCNYRIGALGALSHEGGMQGNWGFLDQRACLQWVQREVHHFGGNKSRVTVWGESAGAQSIYFHMVSPGSAGLFHAAVLESSPDLSLFEAKEGFKVGRATARKLGCHNHTDAEVVACLRSGDVDAVLRAADEASTELFTEIGTLQLHRLTASILPFKPVIDGVDLLEQPMATLLKGKAASPVPIVIGSNHDEMWALIASLPKWIRGLEVELALTLLFGLHAGHAAWHHYKSLYPGDETSAVIKILTDYVFTCSSQAVAAANSLHAPSYVYQNNHVPSFGKTIFTQFGLPQCVGRVCHMSEVPLVFGISPAAAHFNVSFSPAEQAISKRYMAAFTALAHGADVGWAPFNASDRRGLVVGNVSALEASLGDAGAVCGAIWDGAGYLH